MGDYGISIKIDGIGYLDGKADTDLHDLKSTAGHLFHKTPVKAVCVFDERGKSKLYLKKNDDGTITREEEK